MADVVKTGQGGVGSKALAVIARGQEQFAALPQRRRTWLIASAAMVAAVLAGMAWYGSRPEWKVLFSGLEARDVQTVEQELGAAGITFQTTVDSSGVEVPAEMLDKARMEVAAKGMPQTGRLGFELFDKPNWVGSEFDERVNYQRALEGELEHTIGSLGAVKSARVHLVVPVQSLFAQEEKSAKASVVLKLRRSRLEPEEVASIRRLVAGAVENLKPEDVTLVDADGRVDLQVKSQHAHEGDDEQAMEAKLVAMLEPLVGAGNVRTIVNASYDEGSEERTDEVYDPALSATLSMEKTEQVSGGAPKASGVPGTASNTPAAAAVGAVQGSATAAAPGVPPLLKQPVPKEVLPVYPERGIGPMQTMKQENGTFGVTKHTVHREDAPGRLRRVSVAVLVNDRMVTEGVGKMEHEAWKPRSSEEMHRLEGLAQAAVGFDQARGDTVTVENVSFNSNVPGVPAETGVARVMEEARGMLQAQPGMMRVGVMGLLGLLVVMLVLRPVARQMVVMLKEPLALGDGGGRLTLTADGHVAALGSGVGSGNEAEFAQGGREIEVEQVAEHIRKKPVQSSRLLENWIEGTQEAS